MSTPEAERESVSRGCCVYAERMTFSQNPGLRAPLLDDRRLRQFILAALLCVLRVKVLILGFPTVLPYLKD